MTDDPVADILGRLGDFNFGASGGNNGNRANGSAPADNFVGRDGLRTADVAAAVADRKPIRTGLGARLWHYHEGVWLPGGEAEVHRRTKQLLANKWRRSHADNVTAWFAAEQPFIGDEQPTHVINTRSGLLDWRTGEVSAHDPDLPTTFQVPHEWDPSATCPTVDAWLLDVLPPDAIPLVWELLGYLLYPDNPLHVAVLLHGTGRNGKGTFLDLGRGLLGAGHVSSVTLQELGENRFVAAELFGKVANLAGDLDARSIARTDLFKMATGGDPITAEQKYHPPFTFTCRATFVFGANELPGTVDTSEGFFARWIVIPFVGFFPAGKADPHIRARLHAELPGVLVHAVEGLRALMTRGHFDLPPSVADATAEYRMRADQVRQFADEHLVIDLTHAEPRAWVYDRFRRWAEANGHRPVSQTKFYGRVLTLHDAVGHGATNGVRVLRGIRLVE